MVEKGKAVFFRQTCSQDLGSTRLLATLLCTWKNALRWFSPCWLQTSSKFSGRERVSKNTLEHWITGNSKAGADFCKIRGSYCNEKCDDHPIVSVWRCPVTEEQQHRQFYIKTGLRRRWLYSNRHVCPSFNQTFPWLFYTYMVYIY